jgi:hypothetical protein
MLSLPRSLSAKICCHCCKGQICACDQQRAHTGTLTSFLGSIVRFNAGKSRWEGGFRACHASPSRGLAVARQSRSSWFTITLRGASKEAVPQVIDTPVGLQLQKPGLEMWRLGSSIHTLSQANARFFAQTTPHPQNLASLLLASSTNIPGFFLLNHTVWAFDRCLASA